MRKLSLKDEHLLGSGHSYYGRVLLLGGVVSVLLAIDPGSCTGWATFWNGQLWMAGVTDVHKTNFPIDLRPCMDPRVDSMVVELPQVYRAGQSKGDPNDLIKVAVEVGQWKERALSNGMAYSEFKPNEWKGQVPKEIHHKRIMRTLSPEENARIPKMAASYAHNMMDAIGLGLFRLGRLRR